MNDDLPSYDPDAEFHDQHQDQLEKEQRLEEILLKMWEIAAYSYKTDFTKEDVDFVAAACGKSDYRKP